MIKSEETPNVFSTSSLKSCITGTNTTKQHRPTDNRSHTLPNLVRSGNPSSSESSESP